MKGENNTFTVECKDYLLQKVMLEDGIVSSNGDLAIVLFLL